MSPVAELEVVRAFDRAAARDRRRILLRTGERTLRHGDVARRARGLAGLARSRGWKPGERLVISSTDPHAVVALHLGALRNGFPSIVVDPQLTDREVDAVAAAAAPRCAFTDGENAGRWRRRDIDVIEIEGPARRGRLFDKLLTASGAADPGYPRLLARFESAELPDPPAPEDDAYILFTSGSTARPKGVRVSHRALSAHLATLRRVFGYGPETRLLNVLPLHHTDGLNHGPVTAFTCGGSVHRPVAFSIPDLPALLHAVYGERISHLVAVPTMLAMIDQLVDGDTDELLDSFATDDFRQVVCSAAPLARPLWERFQARFHTTVANVYGLTETVVGGLFNGGHAAAPVPGSVGRPVDCEARIVDGRGEPVADGSTGELELRGQNLFSGYCGDAEATARAFRGDWFRTGDLAVRGADGALRIVGRSKNVVISAGVNVQPEEVTEVLMGVDGVVQAVTFGEPDPVLGERVVACVALADGCDASPASLLEACRGALAPAKLPGRVHVLPVLPVGGAGKVQLERVRELLAARDRGRGTAPGGDVPARVLALAADCFGRPLATLSASSTPADTPGWDSFAHLELVVAIEESFGIRLATRDILRIESLGLAIAVVREML